MAGRIKSMRAQLLQALKDVGVPGTWDHVVNQIGMFSFLGVTKVGSSCAAHACLPALVLTEFSGSEAATECRSTICAAGLAQSCHKPCRF